MADLFATLEKRIPQWRFQTKQLVSDHASLQLSRVNLGDVLRGLRGVSALLCDTSYVKPREGLFIRKIPVLQLIDRSPEEMFFLLCTGDKPDEKALAKLREEIRSRRRVPEHVWHMIRSAQSSTSMMSLLSMGVLSLQGGSKFHGLYKEGLKKEDLWRHTLDDAMDLMAKLPGIAAGLYRIRVLKKDPIPDDNGKNMIDNFVHGLGLGSSAAELSELFRILFVVQSDHEGGNVCNLTCQIVNSVLSDPYFAYSAGVNGLAGPLHGSANQQMVKLILEIQDKLGQAPDQKSLKSLISKKLSDGEIIPGFGHAVLREIDPRFTALHAFGKEHCADDAVFGIADRLYEIVPELLKQKGRVSMPYPNVDAISGPLLYHFGIREPEYYTVVFAISMALGMCAQMVINRAVMMPIFRPRSITTERLIEMIKGD